MKKLKSIGQIILAALFFASTKLVLAEGGAGNPLGFANPIKSKSIQCLISDILNIVANLGAVVAVLCIIYSGFLFVMAQGDAKKVSEARSTFLNTVIGTAILLGAWGLSVIISTTIGKITKQDISITTSC